MKPLGDGPQDGHPDAEQGRDQPDEELGELGIQGVDSAAELGVQGITLYCPRPGTPFPWPRISGKSTLKLATSDSVLATRASTVSAAVLIATATTRRQEKMRVSRAACGYLSTHPGYLEALGMTRTGSVSVVNNPDYHPIPAYGYNARISVLSGRLEQRCAGHSCRIQASGDQLGIDATHGEDLRATRRRPPAVTVVSPDRP